MTKIINHIKVKRSPDSILAATWNQIRQAQKLFKSLLKNFKKTSGRHTFGLRKNVFASKEYFPRNINIYFSDYFRRVASLLHNVRCLYGLLLPYAIDYISNVGISVAGVLRPLLLLFHQFEHLIHNFIKLSVRSLNYSFF